jgi:hypothetical protein
VVASCRGCNARKEDQLLSETELVLRRPPEAPHAHLWIAATVGAVDPSWERWLPADPATTAHEAVSA